MRIVLIKLKFPYADIRNPCFILAENGGKGIRGFGEMLLENNFQAFPKSSFSIPVSRSKLKSVPFLISLRCMGITARLFVCGCFMVK